MCVDIYVSHIFFFLQRSYRFVFNPLIIIRKNVKKIKS